ncbi:hypothetical protein [Parerythrobacter aestuarii]|uniref:hypothetical protein n=1 Tax=Parerythrobacter aestuarii TaxID=3020909 RepID=UPI0024DE3C51|nr:hypothetical protein [Parerythrobacter aestuarii]
MKPMTSALFAGAVLLIVANMMETDGTVSKMTDLEKGELRKGGAPEKIVGQFSKAAEVDPNAGSEVTDTEDGEDPFADAGGEQPVIGDFNMGEASANALAEDTSTASNRRKGPRDLKPGEVSDNFNPTIG